MFKQIGISFALIAFGYGADVVIEKNFELINYDYNTISQKGNGVSVGFIDSAFVLSHPSFAGKTGQTKGSNKLSDIPYKSLVAMHGSHVAGIALGNRIALQNGGYIYGIASNANVYGISNLNPDHPNQVGYDEIISFFNSNNVKIVNNSWEAIIQADADKNGAIFPHEGKMIIEDGISFDFSFRDFRVAPSQAIQLAKKDSDLAANIQLANAGILQVYSSGNEGQRSPSLNAALPSYDESLRAWINVGAIDSEYVEKTGNSFKLKEQTVKDIYYGNIRGGYAFFQNSFMGSQAHSILAPGYGILSSNAYYGTGKTPYRVYTNCVDNEKFCTMSGTSQAAPFVSGAAALVAEKYPFADGRLLADMILSTANSNVELPKIIIKVSDKQWTDAQDNYRGKHYYYDVIYTDISKKDSPDLKDKEKIKQDLEDELNLLTFESKEIVNRLMFGEAIYMSKEELIGQGILDIAKALNGLAKVDANRLLDSDIQTAPSGDRQAFYTINTKGQNGEFSNDIEQVKWKPEWHLTNALNAPKELPNINKIGLEKTGNGTLTLSGKNSTYEGDTIADGGVLRLIGTLVNSNVFARNGEFNLNGGTINKNAAALNGGVFSLTSTSNTIGGSLKSEKGGTILLNKDSSLSVNSGVTNSGILKGQGTITGDLTNNGVVKAGFFDEETDTLNNLGKLEVKGAFTQNESGKLQLAFSKLNESSNDIKNSSFSATSYTIKGGSLEYVPLQISNSLIRPNDEITINLEDDLKKELDKLSISALPTKLLVFKVADDDKTKLIATNKPVSGGDADITRALQGVLGNKNISASSANALTSLANMPQAQHDESLKSMKDTPTATNINAIETMQKDLSIKSTLFLLDPASSIGALNTSSNVFAPTAAFGDEYLGKVDDVFIKTELSAGIAYRRTNHDDYTQNTYLLDLQGKKALSDTTLLGGYIGLSHSKTGDDLSDIRSNMFSLGLSLNHSFDSFGVLLGASAGMSFNHYEQSIKHLSNAKSDANYKNYFANLQAGVYKSFKLSEALALTPIAMFDYSVIKQDSFSQSGALAKNYEAKTTHFGRGWLGANLVYNADLENKWRFNTSLFAFYWRKFNHKDINQNLSFVEAREQRFAANTSRSERQGFYGGIAFGASKDNKFFRISISDEKARAYNQYEIMLRAGISF